MKMKPNVARSALALAVALPAGSSEAGAEAEGDDARLASTAGLAPSRFEEGRDGRRAEGIRPDRDVTVTETEAEEGGPSSAAAPDAGLLTKGEGLRLRPDAPFASRLASALDRKERTQRFLQDDRQGMTGGGAGGGGQIAGSCSLNTCEPNLCKCVASGGYAYDCAEELDALCKGMTGADGTEFTIDGCVPWPDYYKATFCPFAACVVAGGSYQSCDCEFYRTYCDIYKDQPEYVNKTKTILKCGVADCCETKADDAGKGLCMKNAPSDAPSAMPSESATPTGPTPVPTTGPPSPPSTPAPQASASSVAWSAPDGTPLDAPPATAVAGEPATISSDATPSGATPGGTPAGGTAPGGTTSSGATPGGPAPGAEPADAGGAPEASGASAAGAGAQQSAASAESSAVARAVASFVAAAVIGSLLG